nr:lamin B isoform X1 [Portunus trituberculatus]
MGSVPRALSESGRVTPCSCTTRPVPPSPGKVATKTGKRGAATPRGTPRGEGKERVSPLSPTRLSRLQEKEQLQCLDDRLAAYIDRVRQLELESNRLNLQVETIQESVSKEVVSMKGLYESELSDARKLLDDTAKEKAQLQIDVGKMKSANEDLRLRLSKKERELSAAEKALAAAENQVSDLTARLNTSESERKKLLAELKDLREEVGKLSRQLSEAKQQLESETLMRVDLENRCQSLKEELQFKHQIFEQEVTETKKRKQMEISEIDGKLQVEYEAKLKDSLRELRDDYEEQLKNNRAEVEELYETKMDELSRRDQRSMEDSEALTTSLREAKREVQELSSRLTYLEGTNQTLEQRISDLEAQLEGERDTHALEVTRLKDEIVRLSQEMSGHLQECQDLMDVKIALDMEIAAYRKLLEAEEARLHISVSKTSSTPSTSYTPSGRRTPLRGGLKRKRATILEEQKTATSFKSSASSSGVLQIAEDCPEGKFVKIVNTSDKDLSLGGYQIVREVTGGAQTTYKFHSKSKIGGGMEVTVYSCDTEVTHEPPLTTVMKNQKWAVGDEMTTKLLTASEEVATRESKRESETYSSLTERELPESKEETSRLYAGCVLA